jgi:hypothetical protein
VFNDQPFSRYKMNGGLGCGEGQGELPSSKGKGRPKGRRGGGREGRESRSAKVT